VYTGKEKKAVSHYSSEPFETIVAVLLDLRAGGKTGGCLSPVWVGVAGPEFALWESWSQDLIWWHWDQGNGHQSWFV